MKLLNTILFSVFFVSFSFAQKQKCNFNLNEKDPQSGIEKKHIMTGINNQFQVWTNNNGGSYKIGLEITMTELQKDIINKGDTMTILLSNNDVLLAIADDKYLPVGKADEMTESTTYYPFYSVSANDWNTLGTNNIQVLKIKLGKEYYNFEINDSKAKKLKQAIICVK
ncbi:MAG: hypothetical protein IT238_09425 [Bacteroidia bacterium]|nr:hypothetical protein [Bacteroidia bacterium]MCZ2248162.1 hypothetical protein [Bacteroidia bacterium]